ncbi:MAG: geranylgeranylglycerol-phosphate geranylgeranyltransferase [Calditrichaeota bacterium]|nr:geranylgeranylglycerol-phosphate geranylgeranyltransferase [Calditrichota bacterium]
MIPHIISLSRPLNVVIGGLSVLIAASISAQFTLDIKVLLAILAAALITAAANIINDIFDIEIDKINKPERVLAAGLISVKSARIAFLVFNITGLVAAFSGGWDLFFIAFFAELLLYFYSYYFKRTILMGNIVVSLITGLAFIFGAAAVDDWKVGIVPAIFAFLFHLGRELIKDLQDVDGDLANEAVTFPGQFGKKASLILINLIFAFLSAFLTVPYFINLYSVAYLYVVIPGVSIVLVFVSVLLWFKNDVLWLGKISMLLKVDMFIGLIAIFIGSRI